MKIYPIVNLNQLIMDALGDNLGKSVPLYRFALIFPLFLCPDKPSAPVSSKTVDVEAGGDKSIPCLDVIGNPPAAISWYRGNTTSGNNITNNLDLDFKSTAESVAGWYTCFAKNVFGNATVKVLVRVGKLNTF